eukprot:jgi/Mesvir1/8243/Mv12520-RA.1
MLKRVAVSLLRARRLASAADVPALSLESAAYVQHAAAAALVHGTPGSVFQATPTSPFERTRYPYPHHAQRALFNSSPWTPMQSRSMQQAAAPARRGLVKRATPERSKVNLPQEQERLRTDILSAGSTSEVVNLVHSARLVGMEPDARVLATAFEQILSFGDRDVFRTAPKASEILSTASASSPFFMQPWQSGTGASNNSADVSPLFLRLYAVLGMPSNMHSMDDGSCLAILNVLVAVDHADASLYDQVERWLAVTRTLPAISSRHLAEYTELLAKARGICHQQGVDVGGVDLFRAIAKEAGTRGHRTFVFWDKKRLCAALASVGVEVDHAFAKPGLVQQERRAKLMSRDLHLADMVFEGGNGKGAYL